MDIQERVVGLQRQFHDGYLPRICDKPASQRNDLQRIMETFQQVPMETPIIHHNRVIYLFKYLKECIAFFNEMSELVHMSSTKWNPEYRESISKLVEAKQETTLILETAHKTMVNIFEKCMKQAENWSDVPYGPGAAHYQRSSARRHYQPTVEDEEDDGNLNAFEGDLDQEPHTNTFDYSTTGPVPKVQEHVIEGKSPPIQTQAQSPLPRVSSTKRARNEDKNVFGISSQKRRFISPPECATSIKREHDEADHFSAAPKRPKNSQSRRFSNEEAVFFTDIQFEDLSDEVNARLKLKSAERAREKAKLQDKNIKRKKQSFHSSQEDPESLPSIRKRSKRLKIDTLKERDLAGHEL